MDDWTCEFGGLVMGAPDSPISIVAVDGLLSLPEIRTSDLTLVQRHGLWAGDDYMGGRAITLTLEIYGSTPEEFSTALTAVQAAFWPGEKEKVLRFRFPGAASGQTAYVRARPRKRSAPLDLNFANLVCNVVVELFATDPVIYGDVNPSLTLTAPKGDATSRSLRLVQHGAKTALPVINVADAVNPVVENLTTGTSFGVKASGSLAIDVASRRVTAWSGADLTGAVVAGSTWPELPPGGYLMRLRRDDTAKEAVAHVRWEEHWI